MPSLYARVSVYLTRKFRMSEEKSSKPEGRPSKYKPEYCQQLIEFFTVTGDAPDCPMFIDFAMKIDVCDDTLTNWKNEYPEFFAAYRRARKLQESTIARNALKNKYNASFSQFMLTCNHDWRVDIINSDKKDTVINVNLNNLSKLSVEEVS